MDDLGVRFPLAPPSSWGYSSAGEHIVRNDKTGVRIPVSPPRLAVQVRVSSSIGRAPVLQIGGSGFESHLIHQIWEVVSALSGASESAWTKPKVRVVVYSGAADWEDTGVMAFRNVSAGKRGFDSHQLEPNFRVASSMVEQ